MVSDGPGPASGLLASSPVVSSPVPPPPPQAATRQASESRRGLIGALCAERLGDRRRDAIGRGLRDHGRAVGRADLTDGRAGAAIEAGPRDHVEAAALLAQLGRAIDAVERAPALALAGAEHR